jgi:uncharacterized LabA/DUF88 family protein
MMHNQALRLLLLSSKPQEDSMIAQQRYMFFIDGENLVFRFQDMKKDGYEPNPGIFYLPDTYVWAGNISVPSIKETLIIRANYYTSVWGDENKVQTVANEIKTPLSIQPTVGGTRNLYPVLFKKIRKSVKAKSVDIQLTIDILSNVYQNNIDTICIFSGDGDFAPVLKEAIRYGKRVFVGALSKGVSSALRQLADEFINLDNNFFDLVKFHRDY